MKIDKTNIADVFPMSDVSKGMIFYSLKNSSSYIFHEQSVRFLQIENFNKKIFEKTIDLLVDRHENLRSVFSIFDYKEPVQIVLKNISKDVEYFDISDQSFEEKKAYLNLWLENDRSKPFNLNDLKPLWKIRIFLLSPTSICFIWIAHHAISEGWSAASVLTEINNTYINLLKDPYFNPGKLKSSYKDFVLEQIREKNNPQNYEFWKKELEGCKKLKPSFIKLNPQKVKDSKFITEKYNLTPKLFEHLKLLAKEENISVKNLCFAAYLFTLYYFSDESDIVVGLLANNRPAKEDGDKIFGCFLNTIPFRYQFSESSTWKKFYLNVDEKIKQYLKYGGLPFIEILKTIGYENDEQNPLFDTIFNYIDFHIYDDLINEISKSSQEIESFKSLVRGVQKDNLFLTFMVNPRNGFNCELLYYDAVTNNTQVDRLMGVFTTVLHKIAYDSGTVANKQSLHSQEDRYVINESQNRDYPLNSTIIDLFAQQLSRVKDSIAVSCNGKSLTFLELHIASNELAGYLQLKGVIPGQIVGIYLDRSVETIMAMLAVTKTGAAYLPISTKIPNNRVAAILADSSCQFIISDDSYKNRFAKSIEYIDVTSRSSTLVHFKGSSDDVHYVIYTSGSTGSPKGVMVTQRNVINLIYGLNEIIFRKYGDNLNLALVSPFDFDASVQHIYGALLFGYTLHIVPEPVRVDGEALVKFFESENIEISDGTPTHLRLIMESKKPLPSNLKHFLIAGEVLPSQVVSAFYTSHKAAITNLYGPTETCVDSTYYHIQKDNFVELETIPIGKPLFNERIYILSKDGQEQGIEVPGEIVIGGEGVSMGYINKAELTKSKFVEYPAGGNRLSYRTGDIGKRLANGNIEYIGRVDSQVKLRGYRIELGEIELQMLQINKIKSAYVMVESDNVGEKILSAYYTSDFPLEKEFIRSALFAFLPNYMVPDRFIEIDEIPLTPNGKVDRLKLRQLSSGKIGLKQKPKNTIEEKILKIWASVLGLEEDKIGTNDEFIHLGGHSLRLMKLLGHIQKEFQVKINLKSLLQKNTIRNLAKMVSEEKSFKHIPVTKKDQKEQYALTQSQLNIYLFQQKNRESIVYNMPQFFEFLAEPDQNKLDYAFKQIVERHESLRTSFTEISGVPIQKVHSINEVDFALERQYLNSNIPTSEKSIFKSFIRSFDLEKAPLIRMGILTGETKSYLMIDLHHIISDRISNQILAREFVEFYNGYELKYPELQYSDYVEWMNLEEIKIQMHEQENYWLKKFDLAPKLLTFPTCSGMVTSMEYGVATEKFEVDEEDFRKLQKLCNEQKITPYAFALSCYILILSKVAGEDDISVAVPLSGRWHSDIQNIVGNFVNIAILRNFLDSSKSFLTTLQEIKDEISDGMENQHYNVDNLIDKLTTKHSCNFQDLLTVAFDLVQHTDSPKDNKCSPLLQPTSFSERQTTPYLLLLVGHLVDSKLFFNLDYKSNLLSPSFISHFISNFTQVIKQVLVDPEVKIGEIQLKNQLEEASMLFEEEVGDFNF